MFAKTIVLSDAFLDMPMSARCLYMTLGMVADDDGFVNSPKSVMRQCGASDDDLSVLLLKKFVLGFEDGVLVIKHWRINNYLRNDRYTETNYLEDKAKLSIDENGAYSRNGSDVGIPVGIPSSGIPSSGIPSIGKDSIGKDSIGHSNTREDDFERWWKEYPKKVGKQAAKTAFMKVHEPVETLIKAVQEQTYSKQWTIEGGRYIPNPATWLNQGRWDDEVQKTTHEGGFEQRTKKMDISDIEIDL